MFKRLAQATVWAPNGIRREDWRFRGIFRFVLPFTDIFFLWFGVVGVINGVASVQDVTSASWQTGWSAGIALFSLLAFLGVSFPKLWWLELSGKAFLIGLVTGYIALFLARGFSDPAVLATAGLIVILILLPIWRVGDLATKLGESLVTWRKRRSQDTP